MTTQRLSPVEAYYLKRRAIVEEAFAAFVVAERASREKMMRDMPPYPVHLIPHPTVQMVREGGEAI